MSQIEVFDKMTAPDTTGVGLRGCLKGTFYQLKELLGEPTYDQPSGDGKVQVEWVVKYKEEIFTIYDWKTYCREYTLHQLNEFNVGGKSYAYDFISYLESQLKPKINYEI